METLLNPQRKINKAAIGIMAAVAILVVCAALVLGSSSNKAEPAKAIVVMEPVALSSAIGASDDNIPNGILNQRLSDLRHLQQEYNIAVTSGKDKVALETLRKSILGAEETFRTSIDSSWISAITDRNSDSLQLKVIATYRSSLDSIRMVNSSLTAATASEDFVPDRQAFIKLQDELMDKTNEIALLKSTIEVMQKQSANARPDFENLSGNEAKIPAEIENKIVELTSGNQRLQQEIERLKKQTLEDLKNNNAEQILLSKNTALQQKVNSINAELQLVRVDCNLSRVDATQIISNSKQRKQLLSEASGILTSLSASSDADIRNKVKEKIVRLNQVAANTRD